MTLIFLTFLYQVVASADMTLAFFNMKNIYNNVLNEITNEILDWPAIPLTYLITRLICLTA